MEIKAYKIYNPKTGLFSNGGSYSRWNKYGKTWNTIGQIKSHITMLKSSMKYYSDNSAAELLGIYIKDKCVIIALVPEIKSSSIVEESVPMSNLI
jgi:hypothetical protein